MRFHTNRQKHHQIAEMPMINKDGGITMQAGGLFRNPLYLSRRWRSVFILTGGGIDVKEAAAREEEVLGRGRCI